MKKLLLTIAAAFAALLGEAKAITITDLDLFSPSEGYLSANESLTRTFELSPFNPATQDVTAGFVTFVFADLLTPFATNSVDINLGAYDFANGGFSLFALFGPAGLTTQILGDLNEDGQLVYTIKNTGNSAFSVISATLTATVVNAPPAPTQSVPDGGSMVAMLGLSMAGLGFIRRKFMVA